MSRVANFDFGSNDIGAKFIDPPLGPDARGLPLILKANPCSILILVLVLVTEPCRPNVDTQESDCETLLLYIVYLHILVKHN